MKVNPSSSYITVQQVELTDKGKTGLFVPTKAKVFQVISSGSTKYDVDQIVILGGPLVPTKVELPSGDFYIVHEDSIVGTLSAD